MIERGSLDTRNRDNTESLSLSLSLDRLLDRSK